ncbi:hypothetical protein J2800_000967 [Caulobacter rhizosphaerae]|uniref:Nucleotidyltransferase AbiEii toxin of type IV toxin-antitoxin system n=1 Tax=Caulobacter rhizosphaerae TaxID=2010972 RepID=A0ABU1MWE8_9CAUL|nr:hypothetical protein [Caulobacter rhizosphaerae]MDR6530231.1 hypothetical protein [Caulobacter rhizosphaerae]
MSSWLPDIDIAIACDRACFLDGLAELGRASGRFEVERFDQAMGEVGYEAARFDWRAQSPHRDLGFVLMSPPDRPTPIRVELTAQRWSPDPPTYDAYVAAAQMMVKPLLSAWNKAQATRCRLRIERCGAGRWEPTARTSQLVKRFAILANAASLHPLDWGRFYGLVREGRQRIPEANLRAMLVEHGFASQKAEDLAELYAHLWAFKTLHQGLGPGRR